MKRRVISIAVSLCTILSLLPVSVYAEGLNAPYYNAGASVSGNESVSGNGNENISGNSTQHAASQENNTLTAVEKVQTMLNALPTVTELEGAEEATINAAYEAAQNVYDAIEELEAEEIALLTDMEKLSALMDWFNGRVMTLEGEVIVSKEDELWEAIINAGVDVILGNNISLTKDLMINSNRKIKTNDYTLTGTIKPTNCTLTVEGVLDANIVTNDGDIVYLEGGTYNGNVSLNSFSAINSGTYNGKITGTGIIENGTFNNTVTCNSINKGVFNDTVTSNRVYDGEFHDVCTVSQGYENGIEKGIFYKTPSYTYTKTLSSGVSSYYITYINGDSTYATEYMNSLSQNYLSRTQYANSFTPPTKPDFTFEGWYKNSNLTGETFNRDSLSTGDFDENGNLTLYAKWKHNDNAHVDENGDRVCDICNNQITAGYIKNGTTLLIYPGTNFSNTSVLTGITKIINHGTITDGNYPSTITIENKSDGTIEDGIFDNTVTNEGTIENGTYFNTVTNNGTIVNGSFYCTVTNNGTIKGGFFNNPVTNNNTISGGSFYDTVNNSGTVSGGNFELAQPISGIYTVAFDSKGGSAVGKQWRAKAPATKPTDPTKNGKTFCGWFVKNNDESYSLYDFSANVTEDITLYANWDCELTGHIDTTPKDHNCDVCNTIFSSCSGGMATCKNQAVCTYCNKPYGEVNGTNHAVTEVRNVKNATCTEAGYTGDTYCKDCGAKLQDGKPITKLGHVDADKNHICDVETCKATITTCSGGDAATCIKKSVCDYCGEEYGELDSSNHTGGTEIKNDKDAACTEEGYTGDTYCKSCKAKISSGTSVAAKGHTDVNKDHICDVETCKATIGSCSGGDAATCIKKSICIYCGKEYGSLDENNHTLKHHQKNAATIEATGNKEYWQCTDCGRLFMDENGKVATEQKDIIIKKLIGMLDGMGQSMNAGESKALSFRSSAEFSDFLYVELDGNTVDAKNYTAKEGSTIITLNAEYVASLPAGEHTISIVSTTGTASTSFTILEASSSNTPNEPENPSNNGPASPSSNEKASSVANEPVMTVTTEKASPATGDDNHMGLWIAVILVGVLLIRNSKFGMRNYISDSGLSARE